MKNGMNPQALAHIEMIKDAERLIKMWEKSLPDPVAESEIWQLEDLKKGFVKDLLAVLVKSEIRFGDLEPFLLTAMDFLKKAPRNKPLGIFLLTLALIWAMLIVAAMDMGEF